MRNQFFYTRTVRTEVPARENAEGYIEVREFRDSFNLEMVIRTVTLETGAVVVLLNDIHEQTSQEPIINTNTNKVKGYKDVRNNVQSEISLSPEDGRRFFNATNVESAFETPSYNEERREILERSNGGRNIMTVTEDFKNEEWNPEEKETVTE